MSALLLSSCAHASRGESMKKSNKAWVVSEVSPVEVLGTVFAPGATIPANTLPEVSVSWLEEQGYITMASGKGVAADEAPAGEED